MEGLSKLKTNQGKKLTYSEALVLNGGIIWSCVGSILKVHGVIVVVVKAITECNIRSFTASLIYLQ
ncbi:hypothetical protein DY000_02005640 [Brassica cretica]|uniref:Uncharacterized protein n=1 Tax=Brassica cretica TaxID=69181 RepID=A0ABQ7BUF7_BRACR|nr:hypothetical protein DY000_02005640 [Brassica cretica]